MARNEPLNFVPYGRAASGRSPSFAFASKVDGVTVRSLRIPSPASKMDPGVARPSCKHATSITPAR